MNFTPTHLTPDGTPVEVSAQYGTARTRTGRDTVFAESELFPLGSAEAEEILAPLVKADQAQAVADTLEDRVALARWTKCLGNARDTLASGVAQVLALRGSEGPGWAARRKLEETLRVALEDLADFSR